MKGCWGGDCQSISQGRDCQGGTVREGLSGEGLSGEGLEEGETSDARLSQSIGSCARFNWLHLTGESRQFIHTVTAEALKLPIDQ